jgi:hypothetical protein
LIVNQAGGRDRSEGQPVSIYLVVEKRGMVNQLWSWFGDLSVTIVALGGYASQSLCDEVKRDVRRQGRPAILLYAGDHDSSGEDIYRDFLARTDCWKETRRIALTPEQVTEYELPEYAPTDDELRKLQDDPRAKTFEQRHGSLVQYELDALPPDELRYLYRTAIDEFWDEAAYQDVLQREAEERDPAERQRGLELLAEVRDMCLQLRFFRTHLPVVELCAARKRVRIGDREDAISAMRKAWTIFSGQDNSYTAFGAPRFWWRHCWNRGAEGDVAEAEAATERLAAAPADDGLALRDIWLLRLRALLARAQGDQARVIGTIAIATATWRERLASRGISRGPTQCHDGRRDWRACVAPEGCLSPTAGGKLLTMPARSTP